MDIQMHTPAADTAGFATDAQASASSCCSTAEQEACCTPVEKDACCGTAASGGCGCQ
ncbi:MAG TPA: hypothetical protein VFY65_06995 [Longimicrobium sp.]|nr:hypothetical protein [Longimicrobium sp.]